MAEKIANEKGFYVIKTSGEEIISCNPLNRAICDRCNSTSSNGYYVAALNYWMCPECYNFWNKESIRYISDIPYEITKYNALCESLNISMYKDV